MEEWTNRFNPFNSDKLFAQLYRWKEIQKGKVMPAPALVTIDPTNICNLKCVWCNADYIQKKNPKQIDSEVLDAIADFLPKWGNHPFWKGVESVCIAGGGEPLTHPHTGKLIERLYKNGVGAGIVTNGVYINNHLESLVNCDWVGVSVDAGSREVYKELKGKDEFDKVIYNIKELVKRQEGTKLGEPGQGHGVSYKFLMHPGNVKDIYTAASLAKEIGCRNFHLRPFGIPWDKIHSSEDRESSKVFSYQDIEEFRNQIQEARKLEDENFKIFAVTHKFDGNLDRVHNFKQCKAVFMTAVFEAPTEKGKGFNLGLCCDRRGDPSLTIENIKDANYINEFWGSDKHWEMAEKIKVGTCPRCTYQPHNIMYEQCIEKDNLTYSFI